MIGGSRSITATACRREDNASASLALTASGGAEPAVFFFFFLFLFFLPPDVADSVTTARSAARAYIAEGSR